MTLNAPSAGARAWCLGGDVCGECLGRLDAKTVRTYTFRHAIIADRKNGYYRLHLRLDLLLSMPELGTE